MKPEVVPQSYPRQGVDSTLLAAMTVELRELAEFLYKQVCAEHHRRGQLKQRCRDALKNHALQQKCAVDDSAASRLVRSLVDSDNCDDPLVWVPSKTVASALARCDAGCEPIELGVLGIAMQESEDRSVNCMAGADGTWAGTSVDSSMESPISSPSASQVNLEDPTLDAFAAWAVGRFGSLPHAFDEIGGLPMGATDPYMVPEDHWIEGCDVAVFPGDAVKVYRQLVARAGRGPLRKGDFLRVLSTADIRVGTVPLQSSTQGGLGGTTGIATTSYLSLESSSHLRPESSEEWMAPESTAEYAQTSNAPAYSQSTQDWPASASQPVERSAPSWPGSPANAVGGHSWARLNMESFQPNATTPSVPPISLGPQVASNLSRWMFEDIENESAEAARPQDRTENDKSSPAMQSQGPSAARWGRGRQKRLAAEAAESSEVFSEMWTAGVAQSSQSTRPHGLLLPGSH